LQIPKKESTSPIPVKASSPIRRGESFAEMAKRSRSKDKDDSRLNSEAPAFVSKSIIPDRFKKKPKKDDDWSDRNHTIPKYDPPSASNSRNVPRRRKANVNRRKKKQEAVYGIVPIQQDTETKRENFGINRRRNRRKRRNSENVQKVQMEESPKIKKEKKKNRKDKALERQQN
jgi:hypothetical protein